MTVHFSSGTTLQINRETLEIIKNKIEEGSKQLQIFSNNNKISFIINLDKIEYII